MKKSNNQRIIVNADYNFYSAEIYFTPREIQTGLDEFHERLSSISILGISQSILTIEKTAYLGKFQLIISRMLC